LGPLPSAGNRIEYFGDPTCIRVCIVKRGREERTSQRPLLHVGPLRKPGKLAGMGFVKGDVDASGISGHEASVAQIYTICVDLWSKDG
jgi:hypothetical protein